MDGKQKIHCTVESCVYNDDDSKMCMLEAIQVAPMENCQTKTPDESMCASYENEEE